MNKTELCIADGVFLDCLPHRPWTNKVLPQTLTLSVATCGYWVIKGIFTVRKGSVVHHHLRSKQNPNRNRSVCFLSQGQWPYIGNLAAVFFHFIYCCCLICRAFVSSYFCRWKGSTVSIHKVHVYQTALSFFFSFCFRVCGDSLGLQITEKLQRYFNSTY